MNTERSKMSTPNSGVTRSVALTTATVPAEGLFRFAPHNSEAQQHHRNPKSAEIGKRILRSNGSGVQITKVGHKKREVAAGERQGSAASTDGAAVSRFEFLLLPFDLQEYVLRFLPARSLGLCPLICKAWDRAFEGAVASIFSEVVGAARGRSRLVRSAEMRLVHSMRHTHDPAHALEMLLWAAFNGHNQYCLELLDRPNAAVAVLVPGPEDWDCATALHVACRQGNVFLVEQLLRRGAVASALTRQRRTALIVAAEYNQLDVVRTLLSRCRASVKVNATDMYGRTALFIACEKGFHHVVYAILDTCEQLRKRAIDLSDTSPVPEPDVDLGNTEWGSPLCVACKSGFQKIVGKLLDSGACVNLTTEDGRSPLFIAAERSAINTTKIILAMRPPITEAQLTALILKEDERMGQDAAVAAAAIATEVPGVELKDAGTIIDLVTSTGKTALFVASEKGMSKVIKVMLDAGASVSKPTYLNKTPLYAATENGHLPAVKLLLQQCTRKVVEHETNFGTTALFMAQRIGNLQIKNLLTDFCLLTLSKEKTIRDKTSNTKPKKVKQKAAMNRLTEHKEKTRVNVKDVAHLDNRIDLEVRKSKATVQRALDELKQLQLLVDSAEKGQDVDLVYDDQGSLLVDGIDGDYTANGKHITCSSATSSSTLSHESETTANDINALEAEEEMFEPQNENEDNCDRDETCFDNQDMCETKRLEEQEGEEGDRDGDEYGDDEGEVDGNIDRCEAEAEEEEGEEGSETEVGADAESDVGEYEADQDHEMVELDQVNNNNTQNHSNIHGARTLDSESQDSTSDDGGKNDSAREDEQQQEYNEELNSQRQHQQHRHEQQLDNDDENNNMDENATNTNSASDIVNISDTLEAIEVATQSHADLPCDPRQENDENNGNNNDQSADSVKLLCKKNREINEARKIDAVANDVGWAAGIVTGLELTKVRQALTDLPSVTSGFRLDAPQLMKLLQVSSRGAQKVLQRFAIGQGGASRSSSSSQQHQQVNAWEILVIAALFAAEAPLERRAAFVFNLFDPVRKGVLTDKALHNLFACCQNGLRKLSGPQLITPASTPHDCDFWVKNVLDHVRNIRRKKSKGKNKGKGKGGKDQKHHNGRERTSVSRKEFVQWASAGNLSEDVFTLFDEVEHMRNVESVL